MRKVIVLVTLAAGAVLATIALATGSSGVSAETARGDLDAPLHVNMKFDTGARVKIQTRGAIEIVTQRVVAVPGATFGWHSHPGENVNVIKEGTLTLYHDEACTTPVRYGLNTAFATHTDDVHLARNESATETLVLFATYFVPKDTPLKMIRQDEPSPGAGCPQ